MPSVVDRLLARIAFHHARRVYRRFSASLANPRIQQQVVLKRALAVVAGSAFEKTHNLAGVRTIDDLCRALPPTTFDDGFRPYIERLFDGDYAALLAPKQRPLMFAASSGTTAKRKLIPVTPAFVRDYRKGWNTFGLKLLADHPRAILRAILQGSGRFDESLSRDGVPCGAITGLLARTQKPIVRRFYVGDPELARIGNPDDRYYALMRCGIARDVAFAITANPATLIRFAQVVNARGDAVIRDVRDGTLTLEHDESLPAAVTRRLKPNPARATELERLRSRHGLLRPRDFWKLEFLGCWIGGSLKHYLDRLAAWYGPIPVRDIGLLASEGRVTIPLADGSASGPLAVGAACFEFIPIESVAEPVPETLWPWELETGREYSVVLTNTAGLVRYRLGDIVRVTDWIAETPMLEFLHREGRVASVAGEKLTEDQLAAAIRTACERENVETREFLLAPQWADPPFYRLYADHEVPQSLPARLDAELCRQNEEYASRRKSSRLGEIQLFAASPTFFTNLDRRLLEKRGASAEQFKRPLLLTRYDEDRGFIELGKN